MHSGLYKGFAFVITVFLFCSLFLTVFLQEYGKKKESFLIHKTDNRNLFLRFHRSDFLQSEKEQENIVYKVSPLIFLSERILPTSPLLSPVVALDKSLSQKLLNVSFPFNNGSKFVRQVYPNFKSFWHLIESGSWGTLSWNHIQMVLGSRNSHRHRHSHRHDNHGDNSDNHDDDEITVFIGFGEWIGPTLLFAYQFARYSFGIEPDPIAYEILRMNMYANIHTQKEVILSHCCIQSGTHGETRTFIGTGDSTSRDFQHNAGHQDMIQGVPFNVTCISLRDYFHQVVFPVLKNQRKQRIRYLIKIDIEGGEEDLLTHSEWINWLMSEFPKGQKPSLKISIHGKFRNMAIERTMFLIRLYRYIWIYHEFFIQPDRMDYEQLDTTKVTPEHICFFACCCDILLTDETFK